MIYYTFRFTRNSLCYLCERGDEIIYKSVFPKYLQKYAHISMPSPLCPYVSQTFMYQQFLKQGFNIILVNVFPKWQDMEHSSIRNAVRHKLYPVTYTTVKYQQHIFRFCHIFLSDCRQRMMSLSKATFKFQKNGMWALLPSLLENFLCLFKLITCNFSWPIGMDIGGRLHDEPTAKANCTLFLQQCFSTQNNSSLPPGHIQQYLEPFLVVTTEECYCYLLGKSQGFC